MTTLLLDTNYLAHRAWHALGDLRAGGGGNAAIFGVLRDVTTISEDLQATRLVWCFDYGGKGLRAGVHPGYKATRAAVHAEEPPEEQEARKDLQRQIRHLRRHVLRQAGFRNVFAEKGYEADDIIAAAAREATGQTYIVASDQDLWQCLGPGVACYNPQTRAVMTEMKFFLQWGLQPCQWADVKAWAGCKTDDVVGVQGVGEKTAARFVAGTLGRHTKAYKKLTATAGLERYNANIKVVRLPYPGCPTPVLRPDRVTEGKWDEAVRAMGAKSLVGHPPRFVKRKSRGRRRGKE